MTAPTSYLEARSTVGTVPMLCPYSMMFQVRFLVGCVVHATQLQCLRTSSFL